MNNIQKILMERDGMSADEALMLMEECTDALLDGDEDAMGEILGLEDDYVFDLMLFM